MTGVSIALMGIDGCGKTSLAGRIRSALAETGVEVVDPGLHAALVDPGLPAGYPRISLEQMALEAWRLFYAGSTVDGRPAEEVIPLAFADAGVEEMGALLPSDPSGIRQPGIVVSALIEFAGHYLLRAEVTAAALRRGAVCVSDGFPLKNVVRTLRLAQQMPDAQIPGAALDALADAVHRCYGQQYMQPDVGILLDADPELTYRWRVAQSGRIEPGEDLAVTGRTGRESYVDFQTALAKEYRQAAEGWGWHVLAVDGRPQDQTETEALEIVMGDAGVRRCVEAAAGGAGAAAAGAEPC